MEHEVKKKSAARPRWVLIAVVIAVAIAITAPSALALQYGSRLRESRKAMDVMSKEIDDLTSQVGDLEDKLKQYGGASDIAEEMSYQQKYPDFYVTPPETTGVPEKKTIYLTFDDGPSQRTDEILDILDKQGVKATFFVTGSGGSEAKRRMKEIVDRGHTIGMHTYSHDYKKIYASVDAYLDDMYQLFCLIRDTTGEAPTIFRFPGGSINAYNYNIHKELMAEMLRRGFIPYDWNVSSGDAAGGKVKAETITANTVAGGKKTHRGIVLMHDAPVKTETVKGLEKAIVQLKEAGYAFDRLTPDIQPVLFSYKE